MSKAKKFRSLYDDIEIKGWRLACCASSRFAVDNTGIDRNREKKHPGSHEFIYHDAVGYSVNGSPSGIYELWLFLGAGLSIP